MPGRRFAHTNEAEKALLEFALSLMADGTVESLEDAVTIAAQTLDGAGETYTVESVQTCRDLFFEAVAGLTTDDGNECRRDGFASSVEERAADASVGQDEAESWLKTHDPRYKEGRRGWRS